MYSQVEICNMALTNYGGGGIMSMDENTEEARVLNLIYDNCRQAVLSEGIWNFATAYTDTGLALMEGVSHPIYSYVYSMPRNCLKVLQIYSNSFDLADARFKCDFEVFNCNMNKAIATNVKEAKAKYVVDVTTSNLYTPEFVTCLSYLLASRCVEALTRNGQIVAEMDAKYQVALSKAMQSNVRESSQRIQKPSAYIDFRNSDYVRERLRGW